MVCSNSKNGFMTTIWGPMMWHFLHIISLNFPNNPTKKQKYQYYSFIVDLTNILPCNKCRDNLLSNLKSMKFDIDVHMQNRDTFAKFIYDLHNVVNLMLDKKKK